MPSRQFTQSKVKAKPKGVSLFQWADHTLDKSLVVPDIMEFALSDAYLGAEPYPRQGTILKIAFLADELFTSYDHQVIEGWIELFLKTGNRGCQPDIYERMAVAKAEGRPWFREWLMVLGRRGSKGYVGSIGAAYVLWNYMSKGDPQAYYGITRGHRMGMYIFAGKQKAARENLFSDIISMIKDAPCFAPWISRPLNDSLSLYVPNDKLRILNREEAGVDSGGDMASIFIEAKESTLISARGPAIFAEAFDEFGHVTRQVASASAGEIYNAATRALTTFGVDAWIYEPSSPWEMIGQYYDNYLQSLHHSDGTDGFKKGHITRPEMLMFQLESWDPYEDWSRATQIPTRGPQKPPGASRTRPWVQRPYPPKRQAVVTYDAQEERIEAANPDTYGVEMRAHWATVQDHYLSPHRVDEMFGPYRGAVLHMQMVGRNAITYVAHGDPSRSGANFGFAIAHLENLRMTNDDEPDEPHVVFDMITHWEPSTFVNNNHEIDYDFIVTEMCGYINDFMPEEMTFDQGYSAMIIQQLRKYVATHPMPKRVNVWERTATAGRNWEVAETFKTALGMGLIHAPPTSSSPSVELLSNELKFLQLVTPNKVDHPTSGPVTTKDIADCVMILTHALVGGYIAAITGANLMALPLSGSQPGGMPTSPFLPSSPEQMAAAFSNFGRAATPTQGFDPARGRPLGGRGGGGGGRRY